MSELKQELELQKSALMRVEREKVFITYTSYNEQINDLLLLYVTWRECIETSRNFWKNLKTCMHKEN